MALLLASLFAKLVPTDLAGSRTFSSQDSANWNKQMFESPLGTEATLPTALGNPVITAVSAGSDSLVSWLHMARVPSALSTLSQEPDIRMRTL